MVVVAAVLIVGGGSDDSGIVIVIVGVSTVDIIVDGSEAGVGGSGGYIGVGHVGVVFSEGLCWLGTCSADL